MNKIRTKGTKIMFKGIYSSWQFAASLDGLSQDLCIRYLKIKGIMWTRRKVVATWLTIKGRKLCSALTALTLWLSQNTLNSCELLMKNDTVHKNTWWQQRNSTTRCFSWTFCTRECSVFLCCFQLQKVVIENNGLNEHLDCTNERAKISECR